MDFAPLEPIHLPPLEVAPDTYLIRSAQPGLGAPVSVALNSLVIRSAEPVVIDTGTRANRTGWLRDLETLVDLQDVRWVFLSHDDEDHTGNLAEVLRRCPQATLVTTWAASERMGNAIHVPPERMRWVDDGGSLDVGDRTLHAIRPPVWDSPTTRGVYDPKTGVYWASDAFATPMPSQPVDDTSALPPSMWADGMALFHHHVLAPWLALVERKAYRGQLARIRQVSPSAIVGAHTPLVPEPMVERALELIAGLPDIEPPPAPDDNLRASMLAAVGETAPPADGTTAASVQPHY